MHTKTLIALLVFFIEVKITNYCIWYKIQKLKYYLADYITICKLSDPNINDCIKNAIYAVVPHLRTGIPEMNVPPLEPFYVKDVKIDTGSGGVSAHAALKDITAWNGTTFEILDVKTDIPNHWFEFIMKIPHMYMTGNYEVNMKILSIPIVGDGHFNFDITNINFTCTAKGNLYVKDGITHLKYDKLLFKVSIGGMKLDLENLFNNDPVLGKATNDAINGNADIFYEVIEPTVEDTLSEVFLEIANKITETFDYKDLYAQ